MYKNIESQIKKQLQLGDLVQYCGIDNEQPFEYSVGIITRIIDFKRGDCEVQWIDSIYNGPKYSLEAREDLVLA